VVNLFPRPKCGRSFLKNSLIENPGGLRSTDLKNEQDYRVRECIHRAMGAAGEYYRGSEYVKHLQRMNTDTAMRIASYVTPFFWADAAQILVWLCRDCAADLRLPVRESDAA
jgi:hypothetical protein